MTTPGAAGGPPPQFFVDTKKGEINELKALLQKFPFEKDLIKQRDTIKKVIAYMTLGIDVSRLFTDMVKVRSGREEWVGIEDTGYDNQEDDISVLGELFRE